MDASSRDIPARLGRYQIVDRIAAGGMGEVFIGRFVGPSGFIKPVAIKRIHPALAEDKQFVDMLHDEANVAAALRHPAIVATIDVGSDEGNHFVVLDYVSGDPLSKIIKALRQRNLTMPPWIAAWIGAQIAAALHAAHEAKNLQGESLEIVHRDVSLSNIILTDDGHPMLFDFGIAKAKRKLHQTAHGELKGKLPYMAPEMLTGAQVTRAVDIFSLGVVLYEILTNFSPFKRARDVDTVLALKSGIVPPPSKVRPSIDPRLDPIVLTAMASDRNRRFTNAAQIEEGLRSWARAAGAPHEPGPVATWLAWAFPDRIASRRALLARVASPASPTTPQLTSSTPLLSLSAPHIGLVPPPAERPPLPAITPPPATTPPPIATPSRPLPATTTPLPAMASYPSPTASGAGHDQGPGGRVSSATPAPPPPLPGLLPAGTTLPPPSNATSTGATPEGALQAGAPPTTPPGFWIALIAGGVMMGGVLIYLLLDRGSAGNTPLPTASVVATASSAPASRASTSKSAGPIERAKANHSP